MKNDSKSKEAIQAGPDVATTSGQDLKQPKPKPELTEEAIQERKFLEGMLIQLTDDNAREAQERKRRVEEQEIELCSGAKISIAQIKATITAHRQPYVPLLPNDCTFYKHIYRLNDWTHLDPNDFIKPAIVGSWTIELLYNRMGKDIFPALSALNPALPNGLRLHKCFQFVTDDGRKKLERYREEAIAVMEKCKTWNEFRKLMYQEHGVPYSIPLFDT